MAMVEHRHELEAKTKPILDTLRSYQDLPPVLFFLEPISSPPPFFFGGGAIYRYFFIQFVCVFTKLMGGPGSVDLSVCIEH